MESSPPTGTTTTTAASQIHITSPTVTLEASASRSYSSLTGTKVLAVSWTVPTDHHRQNGEWTVSWDNMYADVSEDLRSARSEKGSYFALQRGSSTPSGNTPVLEMPEPIYPLPPTQLQPLQSTSDYTDGAPLSTAKLLAFENGLDKFEETEDLSAFFASRPIVQAPAQIIPDPQTGDVVVYFLITGTAPLPDLVRIIFVPTWSASQTLAVVPVPQRTDYSGHGNLLLHTAWAEARIDDLGTLEEIARELEREGARGLGTGRVKVGVEGGGMDEEAVRREGWMVGEEMVWVREAFLNRHIAEEEPSPLGLGLGLGLGLDMRAGKGGLKLSTTISPGGTSHVVACSSNNNRAAAIHQEEEDDLFALPLSPRSPEMAMSPFSMFRGEALGIAAGGGGGAKPTSRLNQVVSSIDTNLSPQAGSMDNTPTGSGITPTMGRLRLGGGYAPLTPPMDRVGVGKE